MDSPLVQLIGGGNIFTKDGPRPLPTEILERQEKGRTRRAKRRARKLVRTGIDALQRSGKIFEEVILQWFRWQEIFPDPRRQLYYAGMNDQNGHAETLEIDGFFPEIDILIESRISVQGMSALSKEHKQVLTALDVIRHIHPSARPLVAFVKIGPEPIQSYPTDAIVDMRLNMPALERVWDQGLQTELGHANVPRIVFDISEIKEWLSQHRRWHVHYSLLREAMLFAEYRWCWRQRRFEELDKAGLLYPCHRAKLESSTENEVSGPNSSLFFSEQEQALEATEIFYC